MMKTKPNQKGFTIVELMIATTIFSMVLLLCSFAIIHVGKLYYKGIITNRTQDVSRKIVDDISRSIQFGAAGADEIFWREGEDTSANAGTVRALCLGSVRYSFTEERSLGTGSDQTTHVLWKDRIPVGGDCTPLDISDSEPSDEGTELLSENMRVPELTVNPNGDTWDITVRIAYGADDELFENNEDENNPKYSICKGVNASGQFCAVSEFNTTVAKRLQ